MADNQSANPEFYKRTKHFNVKFYYQRAVLNAGEIGLHYIPTDQQAADGLTKPLGPTLFINFRNPLGMDVVNHSKDAVNREGALSTVLFTLELSEWFCRGPSAAYIQYRPIRANLRGNIMI